MCPSNAWIFNAALQFMLRGILRPEFTMIASMARLKTSQRYVFAVMVCKPVCICFLLSILFLGNLTHTPLDTNLWTLTTVSYLRGAEVPFSWSPSASLLFLYKRQILIVLSFLWSNLMSLVPLSYMIYPFVHYLIGSEKKHVYVHYAYVYLTVILTKKTREFTLNIVDLWSGSILNMFDKCILKDKKLNFSFPHGFQVLMQQYQNG